MNAVETSAPIKRRHSYSMTTEGHVSDTGLHMLGRLLRHHVEGEIRAGRWERVEVDGVLVARPVSDGGNA
jgi:hypothetical protein